LPHRADDEEREKCAKDLADILNYMDTLNALDTQGIAPLSHSFPVTNVFRDDVEEPSAAARTAVAQRAAAKRRIFRVPKTVE
jgi:aspartyl-tRNA(Asn)/glutamyl-tRNA(Gln) amidotransferase subunit C